MNQNIAAVLQEALMCSVFVSPKNPGLTYDEILEVGRRFNFMPGEMNDAAREVLNNYAEDNKYIPTQQAFSPIVHNIGENPEIIDYDAVDFVYKELNYQVRSVGASHAKIDRSVLVEKAVQSGINRNDVEGAITCYVFAKSLKEKDGCISYRHSSGEMVLPGQQSKQSRKTHSIKRPYRAQVIEIVRDIVARRTDGRASKTEPFEAFSDTLERIGFTPFRMWWIQTVTELRGSDPNSAPISCAVLSASLVEGALTFAAKHSRNKQLGAFQSNDFDSDPKLWKAEKLIDSAARGGAAAILTPQLRARAEHLNRVRQRVHVGRLLIENPGGVPDLRPEEGRDAKAAAEQIVRAVLDWLDRVSAS